jgi:hypothetical protein
MCRPKFESQEAFLFSRTCREVLELTKPLAGGKSAEA